MIVCLCHRVSDHDIARAVGSGMRCFEVLQDELLVASSCACCHDCAREIFDRACGNAACLPEAQAPQTVHLRQASLA